MSRTRCEREREVAAALRAGSWTAELSGHLKSCAACAEAERVATLLLQHASELRAAHEPAIADRIWRRAQAQRQELALKRATRPLIFMRGLSGGSVIVLALWLLHSFQWWDYRELMRGWSAVDAETTAAGAAIAVLCVAAGAWYLLRDGRRAEGMASST